MMLYHATYMSRLPSICMNGLGGNWPKNWTDSENGAVCFSFDKEIALSFCEVAECAEQEEYESGIVVLAVDSQDIGPLEIDRNDQSNESRVYRGIIPYEKIEIICNKKRESFLSLVAKIAQLEKENTELREKVERLAQSQIKSVDNMILGLLDEGRNCEAIRTCSDLLGKPLSEANQYVEDLKLSRGAKDFSCKWTESDEDQGLWDTGCGEKFTMCSGNPIGNDMRFCCFCGEPIV